MSARVKYVIKFAAADQCSHLTFDFANVIYEISS